MENYEELIDRIEHKVKQFGAPEKHGKIHSQKNISPRNSGYSPINGKSIQDDLNFIMHNRVVRSSVVFITSFLLFYFWKPKLVKDSNNKVATKKVASISIIMVFITLLLDFLSNRYRNQE